MKNENLSNAGGIWIFYTLFTLLFYENIEIMEDKTTIDIYFNS